MLGETEPKGIPQGITKAIAKVSRNIQSGRNAKNRPAGLATVAMLRRQ